MLQPLSATHRDHLYTLRSYGKPLKSLVYQQRKVYNPHWFQGNTERNDYFEGYYFKNISADETSSWSFIPGISLAEHDAHAFVQVINGTSGESWYFRYLPSEFLFSSKGMEIHVGKNIFTDKHLVLDLDDGVNIFKGEISFEGNVSYPTWFRRPGIMGWYRYVPLMECYHGVVSLDHSLNGWISFNGSKYDFTGGRGYIEKDWGSSMPEAWVWMQTNHFDQPGTSFMLSVARIPWIRNAFTGFLGFFLHQGKIYTFATYTGAVIQDLFYSHDSVQLSIRGKKFLIEVLAQKPPQPEHHQGNLKAPVAGNMNRIIHESISSQISISVTDMSGQPIFSGKGRSGGFEMTGDLELLKK